MKRMVGSILISILIISMITGCGRGQTVLTIDGKDIPTAEAIFVLRELERMYEGMYGKEIWTTGQEGKTFNDVVKEAAIDSLTRLYLSSVIGKEAGMSLSEEEKTAVEQQVATYMGREENTFLKEEGITEETVRNIFEYNVIGEKLMNRELEGFVIDESAVEMELEKDQVYQKIQKYGYEKLLEQYKVQHILFSFLNEDKTEKSEEEKAEVKVQAEKVLEQIKSGEGDFEELVLAYSEDPGKDENKGIYTFYRDEMVKEFETAAISLEVGEVSDLVESEFGYHIIKKLEYITPTEDEIEGVKKYEAYIIEKAGEGQRQRAYDEIFKAWKEEHKIEINEKVWEKVLTSNQKGKTVSEEPEKEPRKIEEKVEATEEK